MFRDRMIGGVFEGSNQLDFAVSDTLFIIQCKPDRLNTTVRSSSNKEYRYIRYEVLPEDYVMWLKSHFMKKMILFHCLGKL